MKRSLSLLGALALGAGSMYLLDPDRGRRRRAMLRDRSGSIATRIGRVLGVTARDLANRSRGIVHDARSLVAGSGAGADEAVVDRVRSRLGRVVSHPRAITVVCRDGEVTLQGVILERELRPLLRSIRGVTGLRSIRSELEVHATADIARLRGGRIRPGNRIDIAQEHWAPATRLIAGLAGGVLALTGARARGLLGAFCALTGGALVTRSTTNGRLRALVPSRGGEGRMREPDGATTRAEALAAMN